MSDYTPTYTELEAINLIKRLRNPDLGDSVRNNQDREAAADYIEQVQDVIKALRKGPRQIDLSSCEARVKELDGKIEQLQDFCIWLTGCGYDFCQHDYFIQQRDKLLKDYKVGPFTQPPEE